MACQKDDTITDPNARLLLSKVVYPSQSIAYFTYNETNQLTEVRYEMDDGNLYKVLYFYNNDNLKNYFEYFDVKANKLLFKDSSYYFLDQHYYIEGNAIFGKVTYYLDDLNRIYYENHDGYYSIYRKFNDDLSVSAFYLGRDSVCLAAVQYQYDNMKNPWVATQLNPFENPHNVISGSMMYEDENGNPLFDTTKTRYFDIYPEIGSHIYKYNIQGYPTMHTIYYGSRPETTYFEYIRAK